MKLIISILPVLLLLVYSCSSNRTAHDQALGHRENIEENVKEDKIIGAKLPGWTNASGIEHGHVCVVGTAEFKVNKSIDYIKRAAVMDGETKIISDAPADFRITTQNALTGSGIEGGDFYQIQTKIQNVIGVRGLKSSQKKSICRKIIRYGELSTQTMRRCWVQISVPLKELARAYVRTVKLKYGEKTSDTFSKKMDQELKKIEKK